MAYMDDAHKLLIAERIASRTMYDFRNTLATEHLGPDVGLLAAKALLAKVRLMVDDMGESLTGG